ncbi:MAG: hypothetical protein ABSD74_06640 [Rhizomicrobium sp.]|jgi:hypothetical protein
MADNTPDLTDLDTRIADIKENLRELVEQAAAYSGAKDEELAAQRISDMEGELNRLTKLREEIVKGKG